jgi:hypothetical protein
MQEMLHNARQGVVKKYCNGATSAFVNEIKRGLSVEFAHMQGKQGLEMQEQNARWSHERGYIPRGAFNDT